MNALYIGMRKTLAAAWVMFCYGITGAFSQTAFPQMPQFGSFQPVLPQTPQPATMPVYGNYGSSPVPAYGNQVQIGATAEDLMRQANRDNPYYGSGRSQADIQRANEAWIHAKMMNDPAYNPSLRNATSQRFPLSHVAEIHNLLHEAGMSEHIPTSTQRITTGYYKTPAFAKQTEGFTKALQLMEHMLQGKQPLSLAKAYYAAESAFGDSYMTAAEFQEQIKKSADFIRDWMKQNSLDLHDNDDVHLAIRKFMSERLTITRQKITADKRVELKTATHLPFFYDYNDYTGEKDFKNYFVTKCLATGGGQCSSMPVVYLLLAEALGVKAYLTTAPQHSFIKYPDNSGRILNYEPTSNWKMSNNWYQDNMFISATARRNHLYLDTFNKRQIVADCILSLAFGYLTKYGAADANFITHCLYSADKEFTYQNVRSLFILSSLTARQLAITMYHAGITDFRDIGRSQQAQQLYRRLEENEMKITALGYKPQPTELYNDLLKQHEFKGMVQDSLHIDGKQKRSLFIEYQ